MQRVLAVLAAAVGSVALALTGAGAAQAAVDLDVLFVGAHPDDEAGGLSTYGAWAEEYGLRTGVVTVTRGEGGGNAVGPEEGPLLGLLREAEERRAVGRAGIRNVYNLDKVDFFYTVSAPLTQEIWRERDALERVVRVVRATRPEVIVTMNPSPSPGNHGNHQQAARLAVEAFELAADPSAFPAQVRRERLRPWRAGRLFRSGADAATEEEPTGPACARSFRSAEPTDQVFGVWSGARARNGKTWDQIEVEAEREYASQGWASFEDAPTEAAELECDFFTQLASRVPYRAPNPSRAGMAEGALRRARGGLPLGTELSVTAGRFDVAPGRRLRVTVHARAPRRLGRARVRLALPRGWSGERTATLRLARGREDTVTLRVRAPAATPPEARRVRIGATLSAGGRSGSSSAVVRLVPPVRGTLAPLPQVAEFRAWTRSGGLASLDGLVDPVATLGSGQRRSARIELENRSTDVQSGTVALRLPPGFAADAPAKGYEGLAPGERDAVSFEVANTDTTLKTSTQGGDYPLEIVTTTDGAASAETAALELVPTTSIPRAAAAPALDGAAAPGEYAGPPLDLSRIWEGEDPPTASATARLSWTPDALYAVVEVRDDVFGTILPISDAKRHWRTDSVELAIDPSGGSENTSTTFKAGVFPATAEGGPFAARDADNRQGPAPRTAPGLQVASRVTGPYGGYTLELKLPFAELPATVRPGAMGLNLFVYDSDTQDKTGQNRHGWSTWRGVQGDPYRWGRAVLEGFSPPPGAPSEPEEPVIPREVARSLASPQSIAQSARDDVGLAGGPRAARGLTLRGGARRSGDAVLVALQARERGIVHAYATDAAGRVLGSRAVRVRRGRLGVRVRVPGGRAGEARRVAVALEAAAGGTDSATARVGR